MIPQISVQLYSVREQAAADCDMMKAVQESYTYLTSNAIAQGTK